MTYREISGKGAVAAHRHTKERDYWLNTLSGITGKSCFPYDNNTNRTGRKTAAVTFGLPGDTCSRLVKLSGGSDVKLYMILTAGLVLLLNKYTGSPDIIVGTPIYKPDIEGKFINLVLALRNKLRQGMSFKDLLLQVRQTIIEAEKNRNYPIELLPGELNMPFSRENDFPLFDTALLLENIHYKEYLRHIHLNIVFSFLRTGETIVGEAAYNSLKYEENTIRRICANFAHLLKGAPGDADLMLSDIDIVSEEEKKQLLFDFNDTRSDYPPDKTIHRLFEEQAIKTPANTAVICGDNHLTYRELNERSNRLAHVLIKGGVGPGRIAALLMDNSPEMIIGIIGILKAGGAYLPINPGYPRQRILSMLKDSRACLLLSKEMLIRDFRYIPLQDFETGDTKPVVTPCRAQVEDLDGLQIPDRSLIDYEKYRPYIGQAMVKNSITIHMSRGCVFNCAFCFKIWPRKYIIRSAENIFNEIHFYYKLGIRRFAFVDDLPNINIDISSKVFRLIIENGLKVHLHFPNGIRGDILTKGYIDLMAAAGTITMDLALETTSPRLQKLVRKNLNLKRLEENIGYITREHPQVILELQILHGIPTETEAEAAASLDFIKNIKWVHFPYIHILNIYPQSDMARIAMEHGISREAIENSADIAYHELPETLPFSKEFTKQYQAEFLNEYFLSKERLLSVLPHQLKVLTEDELVQKYNSYLPMEIGRFSELLELAGISPAELKGEFLPENYGAVPGFDRQLRSRFPQNRPQEHALNILLLDLSQYFTQNGKIMYDVVEPPLGLLYLMTHLEKSFGSKINGKIAKSRIDFDGFDELKVLIRDFKPDVIGIRTLNFYKDFFHKTISLLRQWGPDIPIIAGGPYATGHYPVMLRDKNIDLAVLGEGEITLADLVGKIIKNNGKLPHEKTLQTIPGIAFIPGKEKTVQRDFNREILLFDSAAERLSGQSRKNPGMPGKSTDLAYIIYTSGSTGNPKGVMIQHNNLVNQVTGLIRTFDLDASFKYLLLASFTFDVSVMHIFTPLLTGARLYVIGDDIKKDSRRLWPFIYKNKIDILNIVPAFMKAILKDIEKRKIHFRYLFVGGDVFDKELYTALRETFTAGEIINIYGPTETTINAALHRCRPRETGETLPIGKPLTNYRVSILDKASNPVPIGVKGELCISGAGVSRGYLNRPELTVEKFDQDLWDYPDYQDDNQKLLRGVQGGGFLEKSPPGRRRQRLYKTGDLARWLPDGNIEFLGRADNQVKIRGFRIEPGEIEKQLLNLEDITEAVVAAKEDIYGDKYLCAYIVSGKNITGLREYLAGHLPGYMVPAYFIRVEKIPLTPDHKVDRKALPDPGLEINRENRAPRNPIEKKLAGIWAAVLGRKQENMGINTNFFELGGHSLTAAILISKIHKTFNVKISLIQLFDTPTIKGLAKTIQHALPETFISIEPVEKKEYYALSAAQKRLYILNHIGPGSTNYNMPMGVLLEGEVEKKRFENAFKKLILRHETLRTSFEMINRGPVQRVYDRIHFEIDHFDTADEKGAEEIMDNFVKVFDLSRAPLLRVGMIRLTGHRYTLMVDMHHIISDGVSHPVLIRDFMALYAGEHLPALTLQYKDYAQWQKLEMQTTAAKQQETYWLRQFTGEIPVLHLPTDYSRPPVRSFEGSAADFELSGEETNILNRMARSEGATLFMVLLALYNILLSRCANREDIVIGVPISGRRHADLERVIGMFVNTLALRNYPVGEKTFVQFLGEVKKRTLGAFENQDYQFEDLVEKAGVQRDTGRNPLFDVTFVLQDKPGTRENSAVQKMTGLTIKPLAHKRRTSKFDLSLAALETGERLYCEFDYCTKLFKQETITRFIHYFKRIVSWVVKKPGTKISGIEIISEEEKNQILYEFNDTAAGYPRDKTLHRLFEEQAARTPDRPALAGIPDHLTYMTYKQLDKNSRQLANQLQAKGLKHGTIVGIMMGRSPEMIVGILGILKVGAAYLPIDPGYPEERIDYMLADSGAKILLTNLSEERHLNCQLSIVNCQLLMNAAPNAISNPTHLTHLTHPTHLSYIIYTSGTTGRPKGVMIEHRDVVRLMFNDKFQFDFTHRDIWTLFHSYCFDFSVWEMYGALLYGGQLIIIPKITARDSQAYLEILKKQKVTVLNQTPSAFYNLINLELKDSEAGLCLRYVIFGGEALSPGRLKGWKEKYPRTKIINMYGITETTVHVTYKEIGDDEIRSNISNIGKPIPTLSTYVTDKNVKLVPIGTAGELLVGGEGVGRGYLNRPELSKQKFVENPYKHGEKLYRSGDLARLSAGGELEYLGRIDEQVKIRGFRIELGEIENRLLKHEDIKEAVVTAGSDENGDKYLCAYIVPASPHSTITGLKEYLSGTLPEYMIPAYFMRIENIPLTPNGKIDRKALPGPVIKAGADHAPPVNELQSRLVKVWQGVLGSGEHPIGIDDNFFELGGHSLKATIFTAQIHKEFNVKLSLAEVFRTPTIRGLAQTITGLTKENYAAVAPVEEKEYYALSPAQRRLFILQQMEAGNISYNMPHTVLLKGDLDIKRLERTFKKLIARHETLRTSFRMVHDEPVQVVHRRVEFEVEYHELTVGDRVGTHDFVRPFVLSKGPLLRVGVIKTAQKQHILWVDMHHIITDGTSQVFLTDEFTALYAGVELPPLKLQYKDYSQWRNRQVMKDAIRRQEEYWLRVFRGDIPVLELPTDFSRPQTRSFEGGAVGFALTAAETTALNQLALSRGATLFMVLLGVYTVFLSRICGQDDIVVGTPVAGRKHADLAQVIGMFVNTLALRCRPPGEKTFTTFLDQLKEQTLGAFENQDYPFEALVEKVSAARDISRNPLFDVMFVLQNIPPAKGKPSGEKAGNLEIVPYDYESKISKFDLTLTASEAKEKLFFSMEYCTKLFKEETIGRLTACLKTLISSVVKKPGQEISALEIVPAAEKNRLLYEFNDTAAGYPRDGVIHRLFEEQAAKTPDTIALVGPAAQHLTYKQLDKNSRLLANQLQAKGVKHGTIAAIMVGRSPEMIVGILGILKAGGAYLPIDPHYPEERVQYMLKDSSAEVLLTNLPEGRHLFNCQLSIVNCQLSMSSPEPTLHHSSFIEIPHHSDLAYVIYTSGSTGTPKGVMIEHHSVINRLHWMQAMYPIGAGDVILQKTPVVFDVSVWELFWWGFTGAGLCLLGPGDEKDPPAIIGAVGNSRVTTMHFVPSMLNAFLSYIESAREEEKEAALNNLKSLRQVFSSGETLDAGLVKRFYRLFKPLGPIKLVNLYGPTEATVDVTYFNCSPDETYERVPIGKPIDNIRLYIMDKGLHLQPIGIAGELFISGVGVARGYLNKPEPTSEKFLPAGPPPGFPASQPLSFSLYRTGDLAKRLPDGTIQFLGRIDNQVKIRGFRIEPGEIENRLSGHPEIEEAVVTTKEDGAGDRYLCAYIVARDTGHGAWKNTAGLREYLAQHLPDYMIPAYFAVLPGLPRTVSGKIDRKSLPEPAETADANTTPYEPPTNEIEKKLVETWENVLGRKKIGINDNFFMKGGDSIKSIQIVSRMNRAGYKLEMRDIFRYASIAQLAPKVTKLEQIADQAAITGMVPLTPIQEDFFNNSMIYPHHYNQAVMLHSKDGFDREAVRAVFTKIQEHHDALRMSYVKQGEKVIQVNRGLEYPFSLQVYDLRNRENAPGALETCANEIQESIDLEKGPLMKIGLFHLDGEDRLLIAVHHLVMDGVSWRILFEDIETLYRQYIKGEPMVLPLKTDSFKLWSEKLSQYANSASFLKEKKYWAALESMEVPGITRDFDGENRHKDLTGLSFSLSETESDDLLTKVNEAFGTEVNDILLAALGLSTRRTFGNTRVLIALEGHGREEILGINMSRTVGWFTSMYPVILNISYEDDLSRQIKEVKENLHQLPNKGIGYGILKYLTAEENKADLQFKLKPQICFNYFGQFTADIEQVSFGVTGDFTGNLHSMEEQGKYELDISGMISDKRLVMSIGYSRKRYKRETVETLLKYYEEELRRIISYCSSRVRKQLTPSDFTYKELSIEDIGAIDAIFDS